MTLNRSVSMLIILCAAILGLITNCGRQEVFHVENPTEASLTADLNQTATPLDSLTPQDSLNDPINATSTPLALNFSANHPPAPAATLIPSPTPLPNPLVQALDEHMQTLAKLNMFSGAVLVAYDGEILLSNGYGMADSAQAIPNTAQTRFRIASLTKSFTTMAVQILRSRGAIDLHASICTYLSDCPNTWYPITVKHLLTHTSGIPNYTDFASFASIETLRVEPEELITYFRDQPLQFDPGTAYHYGNSGYVLLGQIIEQVSGQSYADFLRSHIFEPLHMHNTGYDPDNLATPACAVGYVSVDTPAILINTSNLYSAGGLYSTVEDLYLWDQALYTDQLIPAVLLQEMFTPYKNGYGYGWKIVDHNGRHAITHPGLISGSATYMLRYPNEKVTVIVLSNLENVAAEDIAVYLGTLVIDSI